MKNIEVQIGTGMGIFFPKASFVEMKKCPQFHGSKQRASPADSEVQPLRKRYIYIWYCERKTVSQKKKRSVSPNSVTSLKICV